MSRRTTVTCTMAALIASSGWALPADFAAAGTPTQQAVSHDDTGLPNFDIRLGADGTPVQAVRDALAKHPVTNEAQAALALLRAQVEYLEVDSDQLFGTPRFVRSWKQFLTGDNAGVAPLTVVQNFVSGYKALFAIAPAEVTTARVTRNFTDDHNGVTHLTLQQLVGGIDLFDAGIKANVSREGRLINISSTMLPRPAGDFAAPAAKLTDLEAIRAAAASVGVKVTSDPTPAEDAKGVSQKRRWNNSADFRSDQAITSERVFFPMTRDELRPAWFVVIPTKGVGHTYEMVIDAIDGKVLHRVNELCFDAVRVYTGSSPIPVPGGPIASRTLVTPSPSPAASPFGWWDTDGVSGADFTDTRGNNVDAHLDRDANNVADPNRPNGGASLIFDPLLDMAASPTTWGDASVVQGFYLTNVYHDRLYSLGFTAAAGNFQTNNYGLGGLGNDAVQFDCQDGSGTNNANFGTPVDGSAGRCQMYLFTSTTPNRDGGLDAGIVYHELTHGLSNRLTGGPANASALNAVQSGGMGEGWSDFVGLCLLSASGEDPNGVYPVGNYAVGNTAGIRRFPYSTNMATNPLTLDAYGASGTTSYGVTRSTEVHNTGEIWCACLWDCRASLYQTQGFAANNTILQLVVDGMKLQPANPTFMQARDAILAADVTLTGGANRYALWTAFARRGLGASASTTGSTATTATQAFDVPEGADAGELPASAAVLSGNGSLTRITGTLATGNVDMYRINICNRAAFSATTVGLSTLNTQLFLFDSNGMPVTFNDDASATTQSTITGTLVPANGEYFLAISGADRDPVSSTGEIWLDAPTTTERAPDGPGAGHAITGWTGTDATAGGAYAIQLTGACASTVGAIGPQPRALTAYGSPTPSTVNYGFNGSVTFSIAVIAGTVPASTGVTVTLDASAIGLGSFSLPATRTLGTITGGNYDLPFHVADDQGRTFDGTMLLTVIDPSGACCMPGGVCTIRLASACAAQSGQFLSAGTVCEILPCTARAEIEPNNATAQATDATHSFRVYSGNLFHMGVSGVLSTSTDADYFNIGSLQVGDVLTVSESGTTSMRGTSTDPLVRLYRAGTAAVVIEDDDSGPGTDSMLWRYTISTADTYYVRAHRFNTAAIGAYQLGISLQNADTPPGTGGALTAETEPNESTAAANNASTSWRAVQYISTNSGSITSGDNDMYAHQFTAGDLVSINIFAGSGLDARVSLLNSAGTVIALEDGTATGPVGDSPIFGYVIPATGAYYVNVLAASGTGSYYAAVYLSTNTPPPLPCPADFNNSGVASVQDIFDFLAAYFSNDPRADVNASGVISVQDLFDFLAAYFAAC